MEHKATRMRTMWWELMNLQKEPSAVKRLHVRVSPACVGGTDGDITKNVKKAEVDEETRGERGELTQGKIQQEKEERRKR